MDFENFFIRTGIAEVGRKSFRKLHQKINDQEYINGYKAFQEGDDTFATYIADCAQKNDIPVEIINLYFYIRFSEYTYEEYKRLGISDDIFYMTMSDFAITARQNTDNGGVYGITQYPERPWLRLHLSNKLYRLGRLQFELTKSDCDIEIENKQLKKGDLCLNVHIARYEPLTEAECEKSYAFAKEFFKTYYNMNFCFFICHSWLLHPWLQDVLPENSSIIRFQRKYKIIKAEIDTDDVISYVFGVKHNDINDYPENSSLQRNLKKYLTQNIPVGTATGIRL